MRGCSWSSTTNLYQFDGFITAINVHLVVDSILYYYSSYYYYHYYFQEFEKILSKYDKDGDGELSAKEMEQYFHDAMVMKCFFLPLSGNESMYL